jgi:hypothetical protein
MKISWDKLTSFTVLITGKEGDEMGHIDIRLQISSKGVARVQALGRDSADRERALKFITRILPALDQIDLAVRETEPVEK